MPGGWSYAGDAAYGQVGAGNEKYVSVGGAWEAYHGNAAGQSVYPLRALHRCVSGTFGASEIDEVFGKGR